MKQLLLVAGVVLCSCGGENLAASLAKAPTFEPRDQAKCQVTKSRTEPLIVEWPAPARAKLESLVKKSLVAVRYAGCEMEVLGQCRVPGKYAYTAITRKNSDVRIKDADELYASMPVYAASLEGALEKSGELNVTMTVVGRYEADRTAPRADQLDASCKDATHVISALTVGAYEFFAGADAKVSGGASTATGLVKAGAKSSAARSTLSQDGEKASCGRSTGKDKDPPRAAARSCASR